MTGLRCIDTALQSLTVPASADYAAHVWLHDLFDRRLHVAFEQKVYTAAQHSQSELP